MLQGASNLWFPMLISALSVPQATDDLGQAGGGELGRSWRRSPASRCSRAFRSIGQLKDFDKYGDEQIWAAIQKKAEGTVEEPDDPDDLKSPEWRVFSNPSKAKESTSFKLRPVEPPDRLRRLLREGRPGGEAA